MGIQLPPNGAQPPILAHVRCGQTAGWSKMRLGMEVGLGPDDIVLDEGWLPPPKKKGHGPLFFGPCLLWPMVAHLSYC